MFCGHSASYCSCRAAAGGRTKPIPRLDAVSRRRTSMLRPYLAAAGRNHRAGFRDKIDSKSGPSGCRGVPSLFPDSYSTFMSCTQRSLGATGVVRFSLNYVVGDASSVRSGRKQSDSEDDSEHGHVIGVASPRASCLRLSDMSVIRLVCTSGPHCAVVLQGGDEANLCTGQSSPL